ncbi:MAG: cobaltochelatase subunit CobN [Pseudomonadota bacterium]
MLTQLAKVFTASLRRTRYGVFCWGVLALLPTVGKAETLFGIISERNSAAVAQAAAQFIERYPSDELVLRTPRQLAALSDAAIRSQLAAADTVLVAGVFSEDAARIGRLIESLTEATPFFAVSSASTLVEQSKQRYQDQLMTWTTANQYWQGRGVENLVNFFAHAISEGKIQPPLAPPLALEPVRMGARRGGKNAPLVALFDYETGDQAGNQELHDAVCQALNQRELACRSVYADWGLASAEALERLQELAPLAVLMLQDFAVGGSERERAEKALQELNVPVLKGIRLTEIDEADWRQDSDGLPTDSVYYRVSMPELSGASQPMVLAVGQAPRIDPLSGIEVRVTGPVLSEVASVSRRLAAWADLRQTPNAKKRVALIYYNHPPGRHNIGADNLDVPQSLFMLLSRLQAEGYEVGALPPDPEALLELIQQRAVNLPENNAELQALWKAGLGLPSGPYRRWLNSLPALVQAELISGPLTALRIRVEQALVEQKFDTASRMVSAALHDIAFVIEGAPARFHERAEALLAQLDDAYEQLIQGDGDVAVLDELTAALQNQGIEGLRGWGEVPGSVMNVGEDFVFPRLQFGNVLIAPQPPRGWEVNEEVLHANLSVPPTHQYLGFYHWLHSEFKPHALVHLGRHSTYEFLPGKRVGLSETDYPRLIAGDVPGLYPYIVDGVGEGLQAKRRGQAVIVDHLTPPLQATPFYDELLSLRQLVESFESADPSQAGDLGRTQALLRIKAQVEELGIREALVAELEAEHGGGERIEFEEIDSDLLVHEVGHFLTDMQEEFMPLGLHVFGKDWSPEALDTMLASIGQDDARTALAASPAAEMSALLAGLDGRFVAPGKGNDPLRSPEALPTGRNFYALDSSLVPTSVAWDIGSSMAREKPALEGSEAVVLWASDTVRDGGVMIAFALELLGIRPVWNGRGILTGLERLPLGNNGQRGDVTFVASGLFRDLYGEQIKWLDKAVLLALDGAYETIVDRYPALEPILEATLAPLGELRDPGRDALTANAVAAAWVDEMSSEAQPTTYAGRLASLRLFAPAPGRYSAGVNRLAERSGAWSDRAELAQTYIARIGHGYGVGVNGEPLQDRFQRRLADVGSSFLGRASNLYGLVDNNDAFDYLGGLNLSVETLRGTAARGFVVDVSNPTKPSTTPLASAVMQELRSRQLNPAWIQALMEHGYAGARTMNSAFFENLWGWEATDPNLFSDTVWEEAKAVYVDDRYDLGVDDFLDDPSRQPVLANILAIMLVAAHKGYWQADADTIASLAENFAQVVATAGLPGSGHTRPDHPMLDWVSDKLPVELADSLAEVRSKARGASIAPEEIPEMIRELQTPVSEAPMMDPGRLMLLAAVLLLLLGAGIVIGRRAQPSSI